MQEVYGSSRLVTTLVLKFARVRWCSICSIDFLPDAKDTSKVDKTAFTDSLGEAALLHT